MKNKIAAVLLVVFVTCNLFSGCGSSKPNNTQNNSNFVNISEKHIKSVVDPLSPESFCAIALENGFRASITDSPSNSAITTNVNLSHSDVHDVTLNYGDFNWWSYLTAYYSSEEAKESFSEDIKDIETDIYDNIPNGELHYKNYGNTGYILFDIYSVGDGYYFKDNGYYYGAYFYSDDKILGTCIFSYDPFKNSEKDSFGKIQNAFGLPTPYGEAKFKKTKLKDNSKYLLCNNATDNRKNKYFYTLYSHGERNHNILYTENRYTIYDERFNENIIEAKWWDYDNNMKSSGSYYPETSALAFSIEVNENAVDDIYYAYYYSEKPDILIDFPDNPEYSSTASVVEYGDGKAFYNVDYTGDIKEGYYIVVIASDKSLEKTFAVAYTEVSDSMFYSS